MDLKSLTTDEVQGMLNACKLELQQREDDEYIETANENGYVIVPHLLSKDGVGKLGSTFIHKFISFTVCNNERPQDINYLLKCLPQSTLNKHKAVRSRAAVKRIATDYVFHIYYRPLVPGYGLVYDLYTLDVCVVVWMVNTVYIYHSCEQSEDDTPTKLHDIDLNSEHPDVIEYMGYVYKLKIEECIDLKSTLDLNVIPLHYTPYGSLDE